jgi:hypothetical protein
MHEFLHLLINYYDRVIANIIRKESIRKTKEHDLSYLIPATMPAGIILEVCI